VNARDELEPPYLVGVTDDFPGGNDDDLVEWAFEAGVRYQSWHSKPRTITTAEEVAGLATGTVLMSEQGGVWLAHERLEWVEPGRAAGVTDYDIALPATVLYEPSTK
jgi:hypothetical protein